MRPGGQNPIPEAVGTDMRQGPQVRDQGRAAVVSVNSAVLGIPA
jgi:hypothetical protein